MDLYIFIKNSKFAAICKGELMAKYISIILSILLITACGKKAGYPWFLGTLDEAKGIAGEKLIMLDFYATW